MDSPMASCEVRYAGVVVGRATQVKDWTATGAFIGFSEPLPSGTRIELRGDNHVQAARVEQVIESADPNAAGMHVSFVASASASAAGPGASAAVPATSAAASAPASANPPSGAVPVSEASPADSTGTTPPAHQGGGKRKRRR